jgi:hypothetical protein
LASECKTAVLIKAKFSTISISINRKVLKEVVINYNSRSVRCFEWVRNLDSFPEEKTETDAVGV